MHLSLRTKAKLLRSKGQPRKDDAAFRYLAKLAVGSLAVLVPAVLASIAIAFRLLSGDGGAPPTPVCVCRVVLIDQSASISAQQRSHWMGESEKIFISIKSGDSIVIFLINDQTLQAKPIFEAQVPFGNEGAGLIQKIEEKEKLVAAKNGARDAMQKAIDAAGKAPKTDILSAFDRSAVKQKNCRTAIYFFSDMIHAAERGEINMEQARLVEDHFPEIIRALARRHGWHSDTLKGVAVHAILPSAVSGQRQPLNDARVLRRFYETMVLSLGGEIVSFETTLDERLVNDEVGK